MKTTIITIISLITAHISFGQYFLQTALPNLENPAYLPSGNENVFSSSTELFALDRIPTITSGTNFATKMGGFSLGINNIGRFDQYISTFYQNVTLSKSLETSLGKFSLGLGGWFGSGTIGNVPSNNGYSMRLGLSLNAGIVYEVKNHLLGISLNNVANRAAFLVDDNPVKIARMLNFRYQTLFYYKNIQFQPFIIHDFLISNTFFKNLSTDGSKIGLSARYNNVKLGYTYAQERSINFHCANVGYDFKAFSLQYSFNVNPQFIYRFYNFSIVSHLITFKYSPNGFKNALQLF